MEERVVGTSAVVNGGLIGRWGWWGCVRVGFVEVGCVMGFCGRCVRDALPIGEGLDLGWGGIGMGWDGVGWGWEVGGGEGV